eukprot:CAMPEP_0169267530 /NCGR_PEP_ID=MMETSP1016-20121227/47174_1 /TAXON_ID=342587 /ORGANISM="Karlodinium micrum, Strain CCMP2283" /LENGTH=239 /DNA_ID=CAMNT_0009351897 /DNA_START=203 /DNA_END=922 /DNA_ORIENTATION=+
MDAQTGSEPRSKLSTSSRRHGVSHDESMGCGNMDHEKDDVGRCKQDSSPITIGTPCERALLRGRQSSKQSSNEDDAGLPGRQSLQQSSNADNEGLPEQPYMECGASGNWVGSPEWVAARASRKKRLTELFHTSIITGIPIRKPAIEMEAPPAPLAPPPKLEIFLPCASMHNAESDEVAEAIAVVLEQLQHTATNDIALRKKQFKTLCARWHPDKNPEGALELATEVFQYLQAQKIWYLD